MKTKSDKLLYALEAAPGGLLTRNLMDLVPHSHLSAFYDNMQRAQRNAHKEGYNIERRALAKKPGQVGRPPVLYVLVKISGNNREQ